MRARLWLPVLYLIVAGYLVFGPLGAAGHGGGGELFFYISLPVGFVAHVHTFTSTKLLTRFSSEC